MRAAEHQTNAMKKSPPSELTGESFDALSESEKEAIFREIERESPQRRLDRSRPLTAAQRARWQRMKQRLSRPTAPKPVTVISIGLERDLVKQADAYAKRAGLTRDQLIARGLRAIIDSAA